MKPPSTDKPTQGQLVFALLSTLNDHGGSAPTTIVADELARRFDLPKEVTEETSATARGNLWRRHVRHARRKAVAMGYVDPKTANGSWSLTPEGAEGMQHAQPGLIVEFVVDERGRPIGARVDIAMTVPTTHLLVAGNSKNLGWIDDQSIPLIVTSPPYHNVIADYTHSDQQLGDIPEYDAFLDALDAVWRECLRVLIPGGRLAINVGPVLRARRTHGEHHVLPLPSSILTRTVAMGYRCLTGITWRKVGTVNAEGGGRGVLGKPGQPNGVIENRCEQILLLKKPSGGLYRSPTPAQIRDSHISKGDYATWFRDMWDDVPGARADSRHPCPFPIEIPRRLVSMFSFRGDVVLDPFGGLGTTSVACAGVGRNSIYVDCSEDYTLSAIARMRDAHRELLVA
jgi:DNA modification methylase